MRQAGKKTKQSRDVIDQAAAVVILQHALDTERSQGSAPGSLLGPDTHLDNEPSASAELNGEAAQ